MAASVPADQGERERWTLRSLTRDTCRVTLKGGLAIQCINMQGRARNGAAPWQAGVRWRAGGLTGLQGQRECKRQASDDHGACRHKQGLGQVPGQSAQCCCRHRRLGATAVAATGQLTDDDGAEGGVHGSRRGIGGQLTASDFSLTMSAFEQLDGVSIFSNPKIIVANEEMASVDMTTKEPNVEVQATRSGTTSDQLDITTKLAVIPGKEETFVGEAFFSYGISLKVTPRISSTGMITVQIEPSISELDSYFTITTGTDTPTAKYPVIKMRRIKTVFSMQSGTTAVIGGLSRTEENNVDSGIPGLRKLPWIGQSLFGWKSRSKEQKEIVIFVTVGIADPTSLKEDIGMPKNAILSRDILSGQTKEPGDRTREEVMSLKDPVKPRPAKPAASAAETQKPIAQPAEKTAPNAAPAAIEPLLKNP